MVTTTLIADHISLSITVDIGPRGFHCVSFAPISLELAKILLPSTIPL
jgi:hypothetical protein